MLYETIRRITPYYAKEKYGAGEKELTKLPYGLTRQARKEPLLHLRVNVFTGGSGFTNPPVAGKNQPGNTCESRRPLPGHQLRHNLGPVPVPLPGSGLIRLSGAGLRSLPIPSAAVSPGPQCLTALTPSSPQGVDKP